MVRIIAKHIVGMDQLHRHFSSRHRENQKKRKQSVGEDREEKEDKEDRDKEEREESEWACSYKNKIITIERPRMVSFRIVVYKR